MITMNSCNIDKKVGIQDTLCQLETKLNEVIITTNKVIENQIELDKKYKELSISFDLWENKQL
ncbi:MAG: hypothetical protein ACRDB9_08975, partial [Cetobacterium sp.]